MKYSDKLCLYFVVFYTIVGFNMEVICQFNPKHSILTVLSPPRTSIVHIKISSSSKNEKQQGA